MYIDFDLKINSKKALLLSHGLFSNKEQERFQKLKESLISKDISYLFFDYPGHGKSEKRVMNALEFKETFLRMCNLLLEKEVKELVILSESFGALITLSNYDFIKDNFKADFVFIGPLIKPKVPYYLQNPKIMEKILKGEVVEIGKEKYLVDLNFLRSLFKLELKYPKKATVFFGLNDFIINLNELKKIIEENNLDWDLIYLNDDHVISKNFDLVINFILSFF
ncbi:MAG TPA: hypothetical protein EYH54_01640 [Nautiliaceae bacterium]|nr:hypothetical protein [Nautiliaceae bacterium]